MVEAETKTKFSKIVENVMSAARQKTKKTSEQVEKQVARIFAERAKAAEKNSEILKDAKRLFAEARAHGQHVTTSLFEWAKKNKLEVLDADPAAALNIARKDLDVALKVAKLPPDSWIVKASLRVQNAESAQALSIMALAPEEYRNNPNFLFQTAAQLAVTNSNPESQSTLKAFVAEMSTMQGKDGFTVETNELGQMLTEVGMGAMPAPTPPDIFQGVDFSTLPDDVKNMLRALNEKLFDPSLDNSEKYFILQSFSAQLGSVDLSGLTKDQYGIFASISSERFKLENSFHSRIVPKIRVEREEFADNGLPIPVSENLHFDTKLTMKQIKEFLAPKDADGDTGLDKAYEIMSDRIFTSGHEARQADLLDQYEYQEFEQLIRYVYGEDSTLIPKYRERWNEDFRRNIAATKAMTGGYTEKEMVTDFPRIMSTDTLDYESQIVHAPIAIAASEETIRELSAEMAYKYERDNEYVHGNITVGGVSMTREAAWRKNPNNFSGTDYKRMVDAMYAGRGSMISDRWLIPNTAKFNKLATITNEMVREIEESVRLGVAISPEMAVRKHNRHGELEELWKQITLEKAPPPPEKLFNPKYLEKIRGFSPLEIRVLEKLEVSLKYKFMKEGRTWNEDVERWKLRRAIVSSRRYMMGGRRLVSLVGNLSNTAGLEMTPDGGDVMQDTLEYIMRSELPERFILVRFGMGKEDVGARAMSVEQEELARLRGITINKNEKLKPALKPDESIPRRRFRTIRSKIKNRFGTRFDQLPMGTILDSTCPMDYSTWRPSEAIWKVMQEKYGEHAKHMAYGVQLKLLGSYEGDAPGDPLRNTNLIRRRDVLTEISQRTPSLIFQLIGKDLDENLANLKAAGAISVDMSPGSTDWKRFMTILGRAERRVVTERAFFTSNSLNLSTTADFNRVFDNRIFYAMGITDPAQIRALKTDYLKIIKNAQDVFGTVQAGQSISYLEQFAERGMPITLTMSDFDLGEAEFHRLTKSGQRRTDEGDAGPRYEAKNGIISMISDPDMSMPVDVQKTLIPTVKKLMADINSYKDAEFAERRTGIMLDAVMSLNVAKDDYRGLVQAIPFLPRLLRSITSADVHNKPFIRFMLEPARKLAIGYAKITGQKDLADLLSKNITEWPKIFGQEFISAAAVVKGEAGNAMLAMETNKFIEDFEHAGLFTDHNILHRLRDKYKTRLGRRAFEGGLRYWWVPIAGAVAVGVIIALSEQGLEGGGKSH